MKVRKEFSLCSIGDDNIVVSDSIDDAAFDGIIRLNSTGTFFWHLLENETTLEEMVEATLAAYNISREMAQVEVEKITRILAQKGLLET